MADRTPLPTLTGPRIKILSPLGMGMWLARSGFRFFVTGHPIDGKLRDNASFFHDATVDYRGGPVPRYSRARWRRVAARNVFIGIPGALLGMDGLSAVVAAPAELVGVTPPGWTEIPWDTIAQGYGCAVVGVGAAVVVPRARRWWTEREVRAEYIYPTWREVCQITGIRFDRREALRMIQLPPTFGQDLEPGTKPVPVRITLPPITLDPGVVKRLERIGTRLGMPGATVEAHALGSATFVDVAPAALPPKRVTLDTVRAACDQTDIDHPVIGVANGGAVVHLDYNNDSPHVAVGGGSGAGKSNTLAFILAQRMRLGSGAVILDFKKWSHDWAHGLPREYVAYCYEIAAIHDALVALGDELMRRRALDSREELSRCRVLDIVVEEANTLLGYLADYWAQRKAEIKREIKAALADDPGADVSYPPERSPAVQAIGAIVQMGREFRMHVHLAGQSLSASGAFGGRDRRASFQVRLLGAWDRKDWNMLASGVPYVPCPKGERGLWAVVRQGQAELVRVPHVIDKVDMSYQRSLAEWVLSAPVRPTDTVCPGVAAQALSASVRVDTDGQQVVDIPAQRVPLSTAADILSGMGGRPVTVKDLRNAVERDPTFPAPAVVGGPGRANLYELPALVEWRSRREAGRP